MREEDLKTYWKAVVDTIQEGVMIVDPGGAIVAVNQALSELTGFAAEELIGRSCATLNCATCRAKRDQEGHHWCSLFEQGRMNKQRCAVLRRDGRYVQVLKNASVLKNENGEVIGAVETLTDISGLLERDTAIEAFRRELSGRDTFHGMVGRSAAMQRVYDLIDNAADSDAPLAIYGESGTGKELVARAIHNLSPRREAPFISVNCAALSEHLLESELFGHEKGAFTDAVVMRKGRFELADTGTLFLDEIGEMPQPLQAKLLRVLQDKSFERVGGSVTQHVDVRILAATNKDLKDEVDKSHFREDLYYRLNVIHIHLTPLRERVDDIPALVTHFIEKNSRNLGKELDLSPEALRLLVSLPWEGNVRELENTIERAAILCNGNRIEPEDVQPDSSEMVRAQEWSTGLELGQFIPDNLSLAEVLNGIEEKLVRKALDDNFFVQARAAEQLGITKSLLQYKMKKYNLQRRKR